MALVTAYKPLTLKELANRLDPGGELNDITEVLAQDNEWLEDAIWLEANDVFSHRSVRRSALPSGSWRALNQGVATEASQTEPYTDVIGMLETYAEVDRELVRAAPNPKQFRMDEATAFIEGLGQTLAATFVYGNANTSPEKFHGLAPRMASLAATANVIGCSGTGSDLTSVFVVQWGRTKVHMVYPRNSKMGISHEDLGEVTLQDSNSNLYQGYRDHFQVKAGLVVRNPRSIARVCNIESTGSSNLFDEDNLIKVLNRMPIRGKGSAIYMNETVLSQCEILLKDKTNVNFTPSRGEGLAGEPFMYFRGNPIRKIDQIVITESALT